MGAFNSFENKALGSIFVQNRRVSRFEIEDAPPDWRNGRIWGIFQRSSPSSCIYVSMFSHSFILWFLSFFFYFSLMVYGPDLSRNFHQNHVKPWVQFLCKIGAFQGLKSKTHPRIDEMGGFEAFFREVVHLLVYMFQCFLILLFFGFYHFFFTSR